MPNRRLAEGFPAWQTYRPLFDLLNTSVGPKGFAVDAAADSTNHLVESWYGPGSPIAEDALGVARWATPAFCNPPYGKGIGQWLDKFIEQSRLGNEIVALLPAYTDVRWWYDKVVPFADIFFLVGRVPFTRPGLVKPSQPNHASAVVLYHADADRRVMWFDWKQEVQHALVVTEGSRSERTGGDDSSRIEGGGDAICP